MQTGEKATICPLNERSFRPDGQVHKTASATTLRKFESALIRTIPVFHRYVT
jgi:hypothetical protein